MENKQTYRDSDARPTAPSFDELVEIIKKLFIDYMEDVLKSKPSEIAKSWERYKTLNHLYKDQPTGLPPLPEPILDDNDLKAWEESKLTEKQIAERKEAVEWYRNPMKELTSDEQGVLNKTSDRLFQRDGKAGARWVRASERLPENDMHMDYPREYCLRCKCDGSRGAVEYQQGNYDEIKNIWQNGPYDVIWWLDESTATDYQQVKESDAVEFAEWLYENRWFNKEGNLWCYTFEQGTRVSDVTYRKNYMKTTAELYNIFKHTP